MNIIFKKMHIDNFMSFDKETFDFENNKGITLITGINNDVPGSKNGCGKSSMINAFVFALFGKMLNQMSLKNVSNRYVPLRNTEVILEMTVDSIPYTIISGIKGNPKIGYCKLYKSEYKNISSENELTKHSVRETRSYIEKNILQTNFDVFLRSFVLTSDQFYNFFKMSKQEKRVFIENIFDLKVFGEMYRIIHKDKLANDKKLSTVDALTSSHKNDIDDIGSKYKDTENNRTNETAKLKKSIEKLKEEINDNNKILQKHDIDSLRKLYESLQTKVNNIKIKRSSITTDISGKKKMVENLKKQHKEKVEYIKKYIDTWNSLSKISKPIVNKKLGLNDVKNDVQELEKNIKDEINKIKKLTNESDKCVIPEKLKNTLSKIDTAISKLDKIKQSNKQKSQELKHLTEQLEKIESNPSLLLDILERKKKEYNKYTEMLNDHIDKKNILTFIENVIGEENIRRMIVSDLIKLLNNQIQTYLVSMGADFTCMFDKDLNYTFLTKNGETEYSSFSSGEKMRMSIATSFAFRDFIVNRSSINSNVLILDEYIDANLDDLAVKEIFKILREFNILYNQNIFVVSHREAVKLNAFDAVYSIDKTDGISKINKQICD